MRWTIALLLCSLNFPQTVWGEEVTLSIGAHQIRATIANTPASRGQGLMNKNMLCGNCGMLFIFPRPGKHSFWMKDTLIPLSIAFIAANGTILNIAEMQANTMQTHSAQGDALYALEMNKGWFTGHAIKAADRVEGLTAAAKGQ